jgi:hypothetical protein
MTGPTNADPVMESAITDVAVAIANHDTAARRSAPGAGS